MPACPSCSADNPERAKFCLECGTALARAAPAQEERKVVSVLFVDLVGFTARSHDADPEDVRAALGPYHALLKREIERFGGTVEKFIGDAVMAVFGAPATHEDDAERAVRAALRVLEAIEDLNESRPRHHLSIRAAVNTGEAVVTLGARPQAGEGLVTGDVVNTASRLQGASPVGGVIVGEITYRSTKGFIVYEELEAVQLKGKPGPVRVWRAIQARSRHGVDVEIASPAPFVGRDFELDLLKSTFKRTVRESSAQLVTILGEPGVGKSRLLSELASCLDEEELLVLWRQGRSLPYGEGITFWALGEIVKAQAGVLDSDGSVEARDKLGVAVEAAIEDPSERDWFTARLAPLIGAGDSADADASRDESFAAWRRFLEAVGRRSPLVVVFEDLHWADSPLLQFIDHLVEWSGGSSLLVLCSSRPELFEKHPDWGGGQRNSTTISLSPLSDAETAQLIGTLLSHTLLPAELQAALLTRAGGNPLYASEFIRMLEDRGLLSSDGRALATSADAIPLPESIHACIAARLDTLPSERKALLHDAAVMGKVFWTGAVGHVGGMDEDSLTHALHELVLKELVRLAPKSSIRGEDEYSFRHALIRDVAYNQIPRASRGHKHRACAAWIESIAGERIGDQAEVLAYHYTLAAELLEESASADERHHLEARARSYLIMAGDRALHLDAGRARGFYERALELFGPDDPERVGVVSSLGQAAHVAGDVTAASELYEEAIPELLARGQALKAGEILTLLSFLQWYKGRSEAEVSYLERAIEVLLAEPPSVELAHAYGLLSTSSVLGGEPLEGLVWAERALQLAERLGARNVVMEALGFVGLARFVSGDTTGIDDMRRSLRLGLELGLGRDTALVYANVLDATRALEGPAAAEVVAKEAVAFTRRRGLLEMEMFIQAGVAENLYESGRWEEALRATDRVLEWARSQRAVQLEVMALLPRIMVLVAKGASLEATSLAPGHLAGAREAGDPQVLLPALVSTALVNQVSGRSAEATQLLLESERLFRAYPDVGARELPHGVRACVAVGRTDVAVRLVNAVEVRAPHEDLPVRTAQAIVWEATGRAKEALDVYAEVEAMWRRRGSVVEDALTLLAEGRCLVSLGREEEAAAPLNNAREVFEPLGARPWIDEVDEHLRPATAPSSSRDRRRRDSE